MMRIPRVRFTIRALMIAVVLVATILGSGIELWNRSQRFHAMADFHYAMTINGRPEELGSAIIVRDKRRAARNQWHEMMGRKYDSASSHPWCPVVSCFRR